MSTPNTPREEAAFIHDQLQWARMRFNEAMAEFMVRYHELQVTTQAATDYIQSIARNEKND